MGPPCISIHLQISIQTPVPHSSLVQPWRNQATSSAVACHEGIQVTLKTQKILIWKPTFPRISNSSSLLSSGSSRLGPRFQKFAFNAAYALAEKRPPRTWQRRKPTTISVTQKTVKTHCLTFCPPLKTAWKYVHFAPSSPYVLEYFWDSDSSETWTFHRPWDKARWCRYILGFGLSHPLLGSGSPAWPSQISRCLQNHSCKTFITLDLIILPPWYICWTYEQVQIKIKIYIG